MAEQNPIKYSDLILPDDSIENLIRQLEQLQATYDGVVSDVRAQAAAMAASLRGVSGATEEGRTSTRGAASDADRLTKAYRDLNFARSETAHKIAELKEQQKQEQQITKLNVQLNQSAEGSYNALSAQYRLNKIALNNLTAEERANLPHAKKLEEETKAIYEEMKRLQEATGKYSLNVGNYTNSITQAIGVNSKWFQSLQNLGGLFAGGFTSGVKAAGSAVAGFGKQLLALLANPIVATIAAVTAAFMGLAKGISSSEENTMALQRIMAPFQRVLTGVVNVLQIMAGWVLKVVEGFEGVAMWASRLIEKLPLVGGAMKKVNDQLAENIELTKRKQLLELAERSNSIEQARLAKEVARLRNEAAKTDDPKRRAFLLSNAVALEQKVMLNEIRLAKEDLAIKKAQAQQAQNNKEANDALAAAQVRLYKAEESYYQRTMRMQSQITKANKADTGGGGGTSGKGNEAASAEAQAKELERIEKQKAANLLKAKRGYEDASAQLIEDEYDRERVLTILNYQRQEEDLKAQLAQMGDDEVETKKYINDQIIALEQQKWNKLADIADKQQKDILDAEKRDLDARLRATDKLIAEKKKREEAQKAKEKKEAEERKRAISDALSFALDNLQTYLDAWVQAAEAKKQMADAEVDRARNVLDAEIEARNNGYANEVETARKELEMAKKNQQKALKEQQRAQKAQEALDTAMQVSSLITATANIWKAFTSMGPWGVAAAVAATALMFGSFVAAKIQAASVSGSGTEEYGEGTVELLQGGSHQSGNDIDLGRKKDGTRRRAEGGEYFAVINKRNSRKYRDLVPQVIGALNDGTFAEKYMNVNGGGDINVIASGNGEHLRALSDDVRQIREQGESKTYVDGKGNTVMQYKNVKRIIRAS